MKTYQFQFLLANFLLSGIFLIQGQTTNNITINRDGINFSFSINCDGGPCEYGQFVTGDYWVRPNSPNGIVTITEMTPNGEFNGAVVNPDLLRDSSGELIAFDDQKQSILNTYDHYDGSLNIMNQLPYQAKAGESIFKIAGTTTGCGTSAITSGCVKSAVVLTILSEIPVDRGNTFFRPPFHGTWKPLYSVTKVKMNRLPTLSQATNGSNGAIGGPRGYEHWLVPQIDLYHKGMGEFHRATIPHASQTPYAADQAKDFLDDLAGVFGVETEEEKKAAVYSLIQKGIDNYAVYKMGIPFQSGAGQHLGKKPPITFFAAMYDDVALLEEVRSIASNDDLIQKRFFQEDAQVKMGKSGMAIWGDDLGLENIHWYFSRMYPKIDSQGSAADPYGYIDGPAGGIHPDPSQNRDRNYMGVAGGPIIGYAFLQHLMPWLKYAAGDEEVLLWSDRVYTGYGIPDFDGGIWTLPDPVAPRDPDESDSCKPFKLYSTGVSECTKYMVTWGPQENDFNQYIAHDQDPNTYGRMSELHGTKVEFNRIPSLVRNYWDELRPCSDPNNSNYPCPGLGEVPDMTLNIAEHEEDVENDVNIIISSNTINVNSLKSYNRISIKLYSMVGAELFVKEGTGNDMTIALKDISLNHATPYIYRIRLDQKVFSGLFVTTK